MFLLNLGKWKMLPEHVLREIGNLVKNLQGTFWTHYYQTIR